MGRRSGVRNMNRQGTMQAIIPPPPLLRTSDVRELSDAIFLRLRLQSFSAGGNPCDFLLRPKSVLHTPQKTLRLVLAMEDRE